LQLAKSGRDKAPTRSEEVPTKNVNLTEHYSQFVDDLVASGKYKNASEVIRAGLRMLEQQTTENAQKLGLLRSLAADGFRQIDQGRGIQLSDARRLGEHIARLGRRAAKPARQRKSG
jgi:antitoxin ParD1/3/4